MSGNSIYSDDVGGAIISVVRGLNQVSEIHSYYLTLSDRDEEDGESVSILLSVKSIDSIIKAINTAALDTYNKEDFPILEQSYR